MRWWVVVLGLVVCAGLLIQYQSRAQSRNFSDYRVYYATGKNILEGRDIYQQYSDTITPFKYSPFFAVMMSPLALVPIDVSAGIFFCLNILFAIASFLLAWKLLPVKIPLKKALIMSVTAVLVLRLVIHCLHSGQVGLMITALVLSGFYLIGRRHVTAGAFLIAAAAMVKYMPAVAALYFFCKREYKAAFLMAAAMIVYLFVPVLVLGWETNLLYLKEWIPHITSTSLDHTSMVDFKNNSVWAMINRFFPTLSAPMPSLIVIGVFAAMFGFIAVNSRVQNKGLSRSLDYGALLICMALFNPNAWQHNFVLLILPYMIIVSYLTAVQFKDRPVLVLLILSFVLNAVVGGSVLHALLGRGASYAFPIVWGTLAVFAALMRIKFCPKSASSKYS